MLGKWVTLFFLILESLSLVSALLKVALKIARPQVHVPPLWAEPALELPLRFAIVGLILSAYLRLRAASQLPRVITRQSALLTTRSVRSILFATIALCLLTAERTTGHAGQARLLPLWALVAVALATVCVGLLFRRRVLSGLNAALLRSPNDASVLGRWQQFTIQNMFFVMSIGLFGFILRTTGDPRAIAWPFFIFSAILLFLWSPHLEGEIGSLH